MPCLGEVWFELPTTVAVSNGAGLTVSKGLALTPIRLHAIPCLRIARAPICVFPFAFCTFVSAGTGSFGAGQGWYGRPCWQEGEEMTSLHGRAIYQSMVNSDCESLQPLRHSFRVRTSNLRCRRLASNGPGGAS